MTKDEALFLSLKEINRLCDTGKITGATINTIQSIKAALEAKDTLKWKLRGHTTLDTLQNEKIAESFGWGKGESYDDCICCSAFNLHDFAEAIRFDERERLVGKTQEPEPDKSSLFSYKTLIAYAASCVAEALSDIRQQSQLEAKDEPVAWVGLNLDNMAEAFHRVIEEHHSKKNPFHDPVNGDAMIALRELRGLIAYMKRNTTQPQRKPLTDEEIHQIFIANSVAVDNGNAYMVAGLRTVNITRAIEAKLKEKNT